MKIPRIIFLLLILLSISSFAQKETYIWYFGKHAGIDFNQTPPTVLTNGALNQMEGCSSICDQAGQLLFYTDGITVWNRNHVAMPNGTGLSGNSHSTNSGLIVKQPGNANIYFVFTAGISSSPNLKYSVVDMSLNGALGAVTLKNVFLRANMTEKLGAVAHNNNQDIWVVSHERNSTNYVKYLVSATGVSSEIVQTIGTLVNSETGSLIFSHCGDKLANANPLTNILDLFDFDRSTGIISNAQQISFPSAVRWLEFSYHSEYLYVVIGHPTSLYQVTVASGVYSFIASPPIELGQLQLAPNGKIYVAEYYYPAPETYNPSNYLGVINNPELAGASCNFVQQGIFLNINGNTQCWRGIPSFVTTVIRNPVDLGPDTTICAVSSETFHAGVGYDSYLWQNGSTDSVFTATTSGVYSVTVTDYCETYTDSVILNIIPYPQPDLGSDTAICPNDSFILDPGSGFLSYLWQNGSTDSTFTITVPGIYWCQVTTLCGVNSDTVIITQGLQPSINLGTDTSICENSTITFHAGGGYSSYLWQNGSADSVFVATAGGLYSVTVTDNCGSDTDSVILNIIPYPQPDLGSDTAICPNDSLILDPGSGFLSYLWQNGSTDSTFTITVPGIYWCQVTTLCGVNSDTVIITQGLQPSINLGTDTSICENSTITFHAGGGYSSYLWQNGSADSVFVATAGGLYSVTVTDNCGTDTDSVILNIIPYPQPDLGSDTAICPNDSFILDPGTGFLSYLWQDGSTGSTFTITVPGIYWCQVTTLCGVNSDTVIITQGLQPSINLGPDTSICENSTITFHAGGGYSSYLWQNGSTDSVFVATAGGLYSVTVTDNCGSDTDSVRIINIYPNPQPNLGNDSSFCYSVSITLDAGSGYADYHWQNGATNQTFPVNTPGTYSVTVTSSYGCVGSDTIQIWLDTIPVITLGDGRSLCDATSFILDPGPGFNSYLWQDGSSEQTFSASSEGIYSVTVTNDCGSVDASVTVNPCPKCICDIPNAFTPNSDGENDVLFVKGSGFTDLDFKIFNRLGEQLFFSNSIDFGWDGKWHGINQKNEVFIYWIKARCLNGEEVSLKGNVTLLK